MEKERVGKNEPCFVYFLLYTFCSRLVIALRKQSCQCQETIHYLPPSFLYTFIDYKTSGEGYAIIINIVDFSPPCQLPTRHGSEKDAEELRDMLVERDFIVHSFSDCTASDIRSCLAAIGKDEKFFKRYSRPRISVLTT